MSLPIRKHDPFTICVKDIQQHCPRLPPKVCVVHSKFEIKCNAGVPVSSRDKLNWKYNAIEKGGKNPKNLLDHLKHLEKISNLSSNGLQMDRLGPEYMMYYQSTDSFQWYSIPGLRFRKPLQVLTL